MDADAIKASATLLARLKKLGLTRKSDLALHLPLRYEDETQIGHIASTPEGEPVQLEVTVVEVGIGFRPRRQLLVQVDDETGSLTLRFLNFYASQTRLFERARDERTRLRVFGEIRQGFFGAEIVHPRYRVIQEGDALPVALTPVYPATAGLSQTVLRKHIAAALAATDLSECLDEAWREQTLLRALPPFEQAIRLLHAPPPGTPEESLQSRRHPAWRRIKFDELLAQQLSLRRACLSRRRLVAPRIAPAGTLSQQLCESLPFSLTAAQQRVSAEILDDLARPYPMQRLLQGDVGSGKTIVAALAACQVIEAGYQAAFMAPTEILAEQHYLKLRSWMEPLGIEIAWLSGSQKKAGKEAARRQVADSARLVVGTHALIQEGVDFARLALSIVDEQHRFGVAQRLELRRKGGKNHMEPHQLAMSATPIPRTLAMSYYADLDVSTLDELPPGRTPVRTRLISSARREEVIERIRHAAEAGKQTYWVCPLIEESEKLQLQTALETHATLSQELTGLVIGLAHGRQKSQEKTATMAAFAAGEIDVLVATTVIEVGLDVPNASLMVIEHAERFGLAQLHQLRGRVGRGPEASVCVLLYQGPLSPTARERLKIIFEHSDGFEIARQDLHLRGPGEFIGSRQSGLPLLRYADLETDADLIEPARELAERLLREAPERAERHLVRWLGGREELLRA